jgi:hypothetical protein
MYMWVHMCAYLYIYMETKGQVQELSLGAIHLVLWDKVSLAWNSLIRLSWMASKPQRSVCSVFLALGLQVLATIPAFSLMCVLGIKFRSWFLYNKALYWLTSCSCLSVFKHDQLTDSIILGLYRLISPSRTHLEASSGTIFLFAH